MLPSVFSPHIYTLPNGVTVAVDAVPYVASCSVGVWVAVGSRDEKPSQSGISHLIEHAAFRRTRRRTMSAIARTFENLGASANAFTTKEETCFEARTLSNHLLSTVAALTDVALFPVFKDADVERERSIILEEMRSLEDETDEFIADLSESVVFEGHPLANPITGSLESLCNLHAAQLTRFHQTHYTASNLVLTVSGNVKPEVVLNMADRLLGSCPKGRRQRRLAPHRVVPSSVQLLRPIQQSHLLWACPLPQLDVRERLALQIINFLLGEGMSSRLNVRLRDRHGLAYTVYSQVQLFCDCGTFSIHAITSPGNVSKTRDLIVRELQSIASTGFRTAEVRRGLMQFISGRLMALESLSARCALMARGLLEDGVPDDPYRAIEIAEGFSTEYIHSVFNSYLDPESWSECIVGPGENT